MGVTCSKCQEEAMVAGMCNKHYRRDLKLRRGKPTRETVGMTLEQRLTHYSVPVPSGCIEWSGALDSCGYGIILVGRRPKRAHRMIYSLQIGAIPDGQIVRHTCDNPKCVNPNHLVLGTQLDNVRDMYSRRRQPQRTRGEAHPWTKLSEAQVRAIRSDKRTCKALAALYNVCESCIGSIKTRTSWAHLPD